MAGENENISARSRARNGAIPDWVNSCTFGEDFKSPDGAQITYLLLDNQTHAERGEVFIRQVIRLETMEAVQNWSQWRLQFEPKRQSVTIHSLKIRRGPMEIDQSHLEKAHFLQREEGLEHFMIHGWFTLLMVLEDVRPGDVLDFAYTIESSSELFPNHGGQFFTLPQGIPVGKYRFAMQFADARQRKWKSSAKELSPIVTRENGKTFWEWSGEKFLAPNPEVNTPSWHVGTFWIQVSDFPDWQTVAEGISQSWVAETGDPAVAELAEKIKSEEADLLRRVERAIRLVQDDCRYLSVNLELGGQIPTPPGAVLRRRYGDCKDLSLLLATLLGKLGVRARPILVNAFLRQSVRNFLPLPSLFNHVVVEMEFEGKRRWIDTTFKEQGGGVFRRFVPDYDRGLPVDAQATALVEAPQLEVSHLFDLHEHVLLDATGEPSLMAVTLHTEGNQADQLRGQFKNLGLEEAEKLRLQAMAKRYRDAKRIGTIKYHDDREANVFVLTEVFKIEFKLGRHADSKRSVFSLPGNWLCTVLPMPPKAERNSPFLLPYPCQINYVTDVDNPGIRYLRLDRPRTDVHSDCAVISRPDRVGFGYFTMRLALQTKAEAVAPELVRNYVTFLEELASTCNRVLNLAGGYPRPPPPPGFGELPSLIQAKPGFTPASKAPSEPISPVARKQGLLDNIWQGDRVTWFYPIVIFWILMAAMRSCSP